MPSTAQRAPPVAGAAKLGQPKLSGPGKDADPLLVLTEAALERYDLPVALTDEERLAGRIPEGDKVVEQMAAPTES